MGQQQKQVHGDPREEHDDVSDQSGSQHWRGRFAAGNYISEEIISPSSLLRSDRFAKSKAATLVGHQEVILTRASAQLTSRAAEETTDSVYGGCPKVTSLMIESATPILRRDKDPIRVDYSISMVKERAKAPVKVRPETAGTMSTTYTVAHRQHSEECGEHCLSIDHPKQSPQITKEERFFSNAAFGTDSDTLLFNTIRRGQVSPSPLVSSEITDCCQRPQLSQSPLRSSYAPSTRLSLSEGDFRQSPLRSKPVITKVSCHGMINCKISELEPTSQADAWSSRCLNLTKKITGHLRRCHHQSSDSQISTSPILSRPHHSSQGTSRDWVNGSEKLPDPAIVTCAFFDRNFISMELLSQALEQTAAIILADQ